jgi:hypothetical protein
MKSKLLATIISVAGLAGLAATSYGQGAIFFDNYDCVPYFPIVYGSTAQGVPPSLAGTLAGSNVNVELGYYIGADNPLNQFTLIPASLTPINPALLGGGYFQGPLVTIPNYNSGPVTFEILAWTQGYHYNNLNSSYIWTEPSIAPVSEPAGFFTSLPGKIYLYRDVPEPSTLALAGMGALVSFVMFRRNHS